MSAVALGHPTLESYFYGELKALDAGLPLEVEAYVVHLLARYARRPGEAGRTSNALALQYMRARERAGPARAHALRSVGDRALFIAGVVPRSLDRTPVDVRYVRAIGEAAYGQVASPNGPLAVFGMLARQFEEIIEVVANIVEPAHSDQEIDLLALYDRWRNCGDVRAAKRLIVAGVPLGGPEPDQTH
jgi:hypothetical protein